MFLGAADRGFDEEFWRQLQAAVSPQRRAEREGEVGEYHLYSAPYSHSQFPSLISLSLAYRKLEALQQSLTESTNKVEHMQDVMDKTQQDHKDELSSLTAQHEKTTQQLKTDLDELVS